MYKTIRFTFVGLLFGVLFFSCEKKMGRAEVEDNLKASMNDFMNTPPRVDTARYKFAVKDVAFYEETNFYRCEFHVEMKEFNNQQLVKDTTGKMKAIITKDFKKITRTF